MTGKEIQERIIKLGQFENKTATEIASLINCSIQKTNAMCLSLEKYHYYLKSSRKNSRKYYSTT